MKVASILTQGGGLGILLLASTAQPLLAQQNTNTQRYIVRLKENVSETNSLSLQEATLDRRDRLRNFRERRLSRKKSLLLPRTGFVIADDLSESEVEELRNNPEVAYVEANIQWQTQDDVGNAEELPSSFEEAPWLKDLMGFSESSPDPYLAPNFAQSRSIVAVIDTGTREDHPYLQSALEPNEAEVNGRDGVDDDKNGFVDDTFGANAITRDGSANEISSSHGTHVSGIIKTIRDHAIVDFSAAQQVSILPVRFIGDDGSGSTASAITAMEYAASRGAKVINASWGAKGESAYSQALYETFKDLYNKNDIFFAVASGNADGSGANNNDSIPHFPANYNIPSLMSVASATPLYGFSNGSFRLINLVLSSFSNYGKNTVHIAAPGDYSDGRGGGRGILSAYSGYGSWGNLYVKKQGTSMASPVIAGVAGVMRAVNPKLTSFEIKELLIQSAKSYSALKNVQNSALLQAHAAIKLAQYSKSKGTKPRVPSKAIADSSTSGPKFEKTSGGCASGTLVSTNSKGSGPLGGNSLGLFGMFFIIWNSVRLLQRKRAFNKSKM